MPEPKDGVQEPKTPATTPPVEKPEETPKPGEKPATPPAVEPGKPAEGQQDKTVPYGALHEERERRKASDARVEQIKALYGNKVKFDDFGNVLPPEQVVTPGTNVQSPSDFQKKIDEMWESDPKQAVRSEIAMAINWFDQTSASMDLQRDVARNKYTDFAKWETEVNSYLRRLPLQQRTQPGMIDLAYKYVKGDKIDQILKEQQADLAAKYAAGEAVQGLPAGAASGTAAPQGPQATDQEKTAAAAMGMTIDDYMKNKVVPK